MNLMKYRIRKIIVNFVLVNLVINAAFFAFTFSGKNPNLTLKMLTPDLQFGLVMLGLLCSITGFINIRKDIIKGHLNLEGIHSHGLYRMFPKSSAVRVSVLTGLTVILLMPLFSYIPQLMGINGLSYFMGLMIKTTSAGIAAALIGVIVIELVIQDYRSLRQ